MNLLEVEELSFSYGEQGVLDGATFSLQAGEIVAFIGPSGAGKSTLFKLLAGMLQPVRGRVLIRGQTGKREVAYMTQEDLLLPWRTALANVILPAELGEGSSFSAEWIASARQLLVDVELSGNEEKYPHELSGGMRQRVALARALLLKKPILLLDEPFGSLDVVLREQLYRLLRSLRQQYGIAILLVTHDFRDALYLSDRILLLKGGKVAQEWLLKGDISRDPALFGSYYAQLREAMLDQAVSHVG